MQEEKPKISNSRLSNIFFTIYTRSPFVPAFMCRFCGFYFFPSFCHSLFPTAPCCGGYSGGRPSHPPNKTPVPLSYRTHCKTPHNSLHPHRVSGTPTHPPTYTTILLPVCLRWTLATVVLLFRINIRRFPRPRIYLPDIRTSRVARLYNAYAIFRNR